MILKKETTHALRETKSTYLPLKINLTTESEEPHLKFNLE